jgi:hypothetical protein
VYPTADSTLSCPQVEVIIADEPSGISLIQCGSQVVVSSVEPASMAAVQRVRVGSVLDAVNGQAVGNMEENAVFEMIQATDRPWRLLLRVSPPPMRQNASSASLGDELGQRNAGTNETPGSTHRSRSCSSLVRPDMAPLGTQEAQRPLELALNQPHLASHQAQEITLAQLPGSSIELGASRRDQRRRSSALSAASSIARHYRPLDDDMEVAQDGL